MRGRYYDLALARRRRQFFFFLRPGECTGTTFDTTPFRLCDVTLFVSPLRLNVLTANPATVANATFVTLEFTSQKNGIRGEVIGLAKSGNPVFCPVLMAIHQILHLRQHNAPPTTPLASYY